jgi:hypothetical protein
MIVLFANSKPFPLRDRIDLERLTSTPNDLRTERYLTATGLFQITISSPRTA